MALQCRCNKCGKDYIQPDICLDENGKHVPAHVCPADPQIYSIPLDGMVGKFGVCSIGRPGYITGYKEMPWGWAWVGIGLDGLGPWSSRNPKIMTPEEMQDLLVKITHQNKPEVVVCKKEDVKPIVHTDFDHPPHIYCLVDDIDG